MSYYYFKFLSLFVDLRTLGLIVVEEYHKETFRGRLVIAPESYAYLSYMPVMGQNPIHLHFFSHEDKCCNMYR